MTDDQSGLPPQPPERPVGAAWRLRSLTGAGERPGSSRQAGSAGPKAGPSGRPAGPAALGRRLMGQIAVTRRIRRQQLGLLLTTLISVVTLLVSGSAWVLTSYVSSSLGRINAGTSGTPSSGPVNILVAGIDTRGGLTRRQELRLHVGDAISSNSDTLMLVHIPADHTSIQVVSLPRDSWVDIPGHGMNKINAAYGLGGAQLMVRTVEHLTDMQINDYIEVNFLGFVKVIDALGGVNVCVPYAINDHYSGLRLSAGMHHVGGIVALMYARDRHSFALSDIQRISDQQHMLSSLFAEATQAGVLANPIKLQEVLSSVASAVRVDQGFNLVKLASELRGIRPSDVTFSTVPLASLNYLTPTGESAVLWNKPQADALFRWLKVNTGAAGRPGKHARTRLSRSKVRLDVYNGTQISGLSADTGSQLSALGFTVVRAGLNWSSHTVARTVIQYPAGQATAATVLARVLPGSAVQQVTGLSGIRLILGTAGHAVTSASHGAAGSPPPIQQHTAAQDACRAAGGG